MDMSGKTHIIIHNSATADSKTVSWGAIRRYHVQTNGWRGIGYHYGIEDVDGGQEILLGRFEHEDGAHCPQSGMNRVGIGICCVGNFDFGPPHPDQWAKCLDLVRHLMRRLNIPKERVQGHNEYNPGKSCPGKQFDMSKFRAEL
jgi:hypothetical protein